MTLPVERSRTRKPVTWVTIVGVLLLPALLGGILVGALYQPTERLDNIRAAIVNNDDPVTLNDQLVPLGRQLTAGLVKGSDTVPSNVDWTISNADDAASGLANGTYNAVVTIPQNFSAAATSTAPGGTPEQANIEVMTSPDARVVDGAITSQITQTAASVLGQTLSTGYLQNVFLGFTTLGDNLGTAAKGATSLANGLTAISTGGAQLTSGASDLASGASALSSGAASLGTGLNTIASNTATLANGISTLGTGLSQGADTLQNGSGTALVAQNATDAATNTAKTAQQIGTLAQTLGALKSACDKTPDPLCGEIAKAATDAGTAAQTAGAAATNAGTVSAALPTLISQSAAGMRDAANGAAQLASGATQLSAGVSTAASGAANLGTGATKLSTGASQLSTGIAQAMDGVTQSASGASSIGQGLQTAADSLPSYTDSEAKNLATVLSDPVAASGTGTNLFGASAVPLLAMLVLWFGGLGSFVVFQAVSARALTSRYSSASLALRAFAPAAIVGAAQGILVAGVVQIAASYDWGDWWAFAGLCTLAGVAFAAVHQALVAALGGAGRWIAAGVGALAVATGIVSTVPGMLISVANVLPTSSAYSALLGALTSAGGVGAGVMGMLVWALIALLVTTLVVAQRRKTSARSVLAASVV